MGLVCACGGRREKVRGLTVMYVVFVGWSFGGPVLVPWVNASSYFSTSPRMSLSLTYISLAYLFFQIQSIWLSTSVINNFRKCKFSCTRLNFKSKKIVPSLSPLHLLNEIVYHRLRVP